MILSSSTAVFECRSRACAPPPVGSGGSDNGPASGGSASGETSYPRISGDKPKKITQAQACSRCAGSGIYSRFHGTCWRCQGRGIDPNPAKVWAMPKSWSDAQIRQWEVERETKRTAAAAKRASSAAEKKAKETAEAAVRAKAIKATNPSVDEIDEAVKKGEKVDEIARSIVETVLSRGRTPSEKQQAILDKAVKRLHTDRERAARDVQRRESAKPAPSGRMEVVGTVLASKKVEGQYGSATKLLVEHPDGWRVWVTEPSSVTVNGKVRPHHTGASSGQRIRMKVTIEPTADDPLFGFGSRPADYEWLLDD